MYVVMIGTLSDGWGAYGTFDSFEEAEKWADSNAPAWETWIMQICTPAEYKEV